jgi:hypothetical protein
MLQSNPNQSDENERPYSYPNPLYPSPAELVRSIEANLEKVELVRSHSNICFYLVV